LETLTRLELFRGRLEESAAYAEEGAELSRKLAEWPSPRRLLPSMPTAMGLMASWKAGSKAMEIQCLMYLAYVRVFQGRLKEGVAFGREVLGKSRQLPERAEAMGSPALSLGLLASGQYEEALEVCLRGTELARMAQDGFLLWHNLDHLGRTYEALLDLKEARKVYEEALKLGAQLGPQYEALSSASLCAVAALSENWEEAYPHARRANEAGTSFDVLDGLYLHHEVEALLRGGDERRAREVVRRFADRPRTNGRERIAYLRSAAILGEFEGDTQRAIGQLHEARTLAEKIGLPKELWQIQSKIGELHERYRQTEGAREAFFLAAQTLRMLAGNIGDEKLREDFLSAAWARRVLTHN
jgi:tetratricopeptide (TPR) repeat protein